MNRINSPLFAPIQRQEISSPTELEPESQTSIQRQLSGFNLLNISVYQPGTTPPPPIQTVRAKGGDTKAAPVNIEDTIKSKRGSGEGLADNIREPMETAFDADFSGVKVHADGESNQLNKSLNSRAFATGQDVFFRQGAYNPGSKDGQELLAHELTHVVQQNSGVQRKKQPKENKEIKKVQAKNLFGQTPEIPVNKDQFSAPKLVETAPNSLPAKNLFGQTPEIPINKDQFSAPKLVETAQNSLPAKNLLGQIPEIPINKDQFSASKLVETAQNSLPAKNILGQIPEIPVNKGSAINRANADNVVQANLLDDTKKVIQNVGETVLGALAGEFNNDPSVTQIIIDGIISLIPILDQIADGRDIAAHIYFMTTKGEYNKIERWIGLAFSLIGCVPELGTVIKSASKFLFRGTAKVLPHLKELLQLIGKILPNGTINSFSSFLSQNWHKYVQQGITKWQEILNQLYRTVNLIPGILLQKKNQVLNKLKEIQGLSGTMLKSAFDKIKAKISKVLDDIASKLNINSSASKKGQLNQQGRQTEQPTSRAYRVQGGTPPKKISHERITVGENGEIKVIPEPGKSKQTKLYITFEDIERARVYLRENRPGGKIVSFEVDPAFIQEVRANAVRQAEIRTHRGSPEISDPTQTTPAVRQKLGLQEHESTAYGLPEGWIKKMEGAARPGTLKIEENK